MQPSARKIQFRPGSAWWFVLLLALCCLAASAGRAQTYGIGNRPGFNAFNNNVLPQTAPTFSGTWAAVLAFPNLEFQDPLGITELPGQTPTTRRMVVWEREGRIYSFPKNSTALNTDKVLMLDLSNQCQGWDDEGLLGLAFHPNFATNHYVFVFYNWVTPGTVVGSPTVRPNNATSTHQRLARFIYNPATGTLDPASEYVLIDQTDHNTWHNGGGMFFHPTNGYLYLTNGNDQNDTNNQTISRAFFGCVLRIDVDKRGGAISHPPTTRALEEVGPNWPNAYDVPNDNPFVGTAGALEEIFALGLRSPHRMTIDPGSNRIYIGDVGEGTWEEINVMAPNESALNFQWRLKEGNAGELTPSYIGVSRQPLFSYSHDSNGGSAAIIGGYVYRGTEFASDLAGKYIFGDNISRNVWYFDETVDPPMRVPLCTVPKGPGPNSGADYTGLSSFGLDTDGEIYMCQLSSNLVANPAAGTGGQIYKLSRSGTAPAQMPATLSATGLFSDVANLQPISSFVPYEVNTPLWSDGAQKKRWFAIPTGQSIGFVDQGAWTFPNGSVFVKHFELPINDNDDTVHKRLETRVLVRDSQGDVYGASYKWRADNSDADIVYAGFNEDVAISGASQLGPTLTTVDIGTQVFDGVTTPITGGYQVTVRAGDIWDNSDNFRFLYQQQTGDFDVKVRVESLTQPDPYTKLGIMARATLDPASPHVFGLVFPSSQARNNNNGGYEYQYRATAGGTSAALYPTIPNPLVNYPNTWLRLKRSGNDFIYYWSDNGTTWKEYGRLNQSLPSTLFLGIAMTSHSTPASATGRFHLDLARTQSWFYPGRQDCRTCHTTNSGGLLGINTGQFNRNTDYPAALTGTGGAVTDNQLRAMNHAGYFSPAINEANIPSLTKLYAISDTTATVEQRMRSYLDANCSQCHQPGGVQAFWDARIETALGAAGIINGYVADNLGIANAKVVVPQDVTRSIMYQRLSTATQPYKMPPLAKGLVDQDAVTLLEQWIAIATQPAGDPLPTPWFSLDVGGVAAPGDSTYYNGTYILSSTSAGAGGTADSFQASANLLTGDGELTALVSSLSNSSATAVAGVMVRETLTPDSKEGSTLLTPGQGVHFERRRTIGGGTFDTAGPNVTAPYWVKIRRRGNTIESFSSMDGVTWNMIGSDTIVMGPSVYFCLVLASGDAANEGTGTFDSVTVAPGVFGGGAQVTVANTANNAIAWHASTIAGPSIASQSVGWYPNDQILFTGTGAPVTLDGPTNMSTGVLTVASTIAGTNFAFTGGTLSAAQIRTGTSNSVAMNSVLTGTNLAYGSVTTDPNLGPVGQGSMDVNVSPTHTGALAIGNGVFNLNGPGVSLSSGTGVSVNGAGARLAAGTYPFDSGLLRAGLLEISGTTVDQIGAQTVTLNGGTLLFHDTVNGNQTNTVQNVKLGSGANTLVAAAQAATTADTLAITNLTHTTGATAEFRSAVGALGGSGNVGRVTVTNLNGAAATNLNGLVGGWATAASGTATAKSFATFTANGVAPATPDRATNTTGGTVNNATLPSGTVGSQNWFVNGGAAANGTIAANTTINSLIGSSDVLINSGAQLTLASGGLIMETGNFWLKTATGAGGKLTTGMSTGELFVRGPELYDTATDERIRVQIVNNGSTPLLLIKTGPGQIGLGGNTGTGTVTNSYTGGTQIEEGALKANDAAAFGTGPVKVLPGGQAWLTGATYTNAFTLSGYGATENAGVLGALKLDNAVTASGPITLATDSRVYVAAAGTSTLSGVISGPGAGLEKTGPGTLVLTNVGNSYTGNVVVNGGTLRSPTNQVAGGLNSTASLGQNISGRTITANAGTTLDWQTNNVFGGTGMNAAGLPSVILNGATLSATRFNPLGHLFLNGATLTQSTTDAGAYEGFEFIGIVTVGGTAPSTISTGNGKANHLHGGANTIFDVADATGDTAADLLVSNVLRDGSGDYPGTGSLQKEGVGTMQLSAANTYTGATIIDAGTLLLTGSVAGPAMISNGGTLTGTGKVTGATTVSGIIAPGSGVGTLTTGALTLASGGNYQWQISDWSGAAGSADVINAPTLAIASTAAAPMVITVQPQALTNVTETAHSYVLVHTTGGISGYAQNKFVVNASAITAAKGFWRVIPGGNDLLLSYTPHIDSDGDGLLDDWEVAMTGNLTTMNAGTDADGDGLNDTLEYALGSSPTDSTSGLSNITHDVEQIGANQYLRLTVTKNPNATNLTYEIVVSGDLLNWGTAQTVVEQNSATSMTVRDAVPLGSAPQRFIRLRVHP